MGIDTGAQLGRIGLAVLGRTLALNVIDHGLRPERCRGGPRTHHVTVNSRTGYGPPPEVHRNGPLEPFFESIKSATSRGSNWTRFRG